MLSAQDLDCMQRISPFRSQRLFEEFLPKGYDMTTLSSIKDREGVVGLKVVLGTLITLYDDFADRPDRINSRLLQQLYRVPFERIEVHLAFLNAEERESLELSSILFSKLLTGMERLPNFERLISLFNFDLKQFFLANHYSELLTQQPQISNLLENRLYLHHNMGIVMAGMIDLMSLQSFDFNELGHARSLFLLGQRAGRISNVLITYGREKLEGDITNELLANNSHEDINFKFEFLKAELAKLFLEMDEYRGIQSFSSGDYRNGIRALHDLHLNLKEVI